MKIGWQERKGQRNHLGPGQQTCAHCSLTMDMVFHELKKKKTFILVPSENVLYANPVQSQNCVLLGW